MIRKFKPVKGGFLPLKFGSFDCETEGLYGKAKLICLVLSDGTEKVFRGEDCVDKFLDHIIHRDFRGYHLYAHNLSFDLEKTFGERFGNSLDNKDMKLTLSGTKLIKAIFTIDKKNKITLLDTFNLIPKKLADIGEDLGFKKFKTPDKWLSGEPVNDINQKDIDYCLRDCNIVLKILELYKEMLGDFNIKLKVTEAANAKAIWKSIFVKDKTIFVNEEKDERFRESYYGGRTEVFIRRHEVKDLFYYDINSLYPSVMLNNKLPNPDKLKYSKDIVKALKDNEGCAKLTVRAPDINYPVLPLRTDKLIFPIGEFTGVWNFPEIRLALFKGYEIVNTHWILSSEPIDSPFDDYINYFMDKKIKYQKEGKKALTFLAKRMMNSLYGKFAQRIDTEERYTHDEPDIGVPYKKLGNNTFKLKNINKERARETVVCWSSYITSYARCALYSFLPIDGLRYCDTDSIVIDQPLDNEVISPHEFGLMSLEDNVRESFYVAPKRYAYRNTRNETIKKIKGIAKHISDAIPLKSFGYPIGVFYSKPFKMKTALQKDVQPYTEEIMKKSLNVHDDKRIFSINGDSCPIKIISI